MPNKPIIPEDPFGKQRKGKERPGVSASESMYMHRNADTDSSWDALHHTLGGKATQAAAGNHKHTIHGHIYSEATDNNGPTTFPVTNTGGEQNVWIASSGAFTFPKFPSNDANNDSNAAFYADIMVSGSVVVPAGNAAGFFYLRTRINDNISVGVLARQARWHNNGQATLNNSYTGRTWLSLPKDQCVGTGTFFLAPYVNVSNDTGSAGGAYCSHGNWEIRIWAFNV